MNRRAFLQLLGAGAAGLALDPERLLWRPGAKTIFLPPKPALVAPIVLRAGDMFTIEGVMALNPHSFRDTGHLQRFIVTADVRAGESVTPVLYPKIVTSGGYQNVTREPFPSARITPFLTGRTVSVQSIGEGLGTA